MSSGKITVVISQAPGKNPAKRALEENLAASLLMESGIELSIVPHLYDLGPDHTGRLFLESIQGDMVVLAWLFPRAAYWLLDRDGIGGTEGQSPLHPLAPKDEDEDEEPTVKAPGIGSAIGGPNRTIWCLDLRDHAGHQVYLEEIRRISAEVALLRQARQAQTGKPTGGDNHPWLTHSKSGPRVYAGKPLGSSRSPLVSRHRLFPLYQLFGVP